MVKLFFLNNNDALMELKHGLRVMLFLLTITSPFFNFRQFCTFNHAYNYCPTGKNYYGLCSPVTTAG